MCELTETLYEVGDEVFSHQKRCCFHRLIWCKRPLQMLGEWAEQTVPCTVDKWFVTWDGGVEEIPF